MRSIFAGSVAAAVTMFVLGFVFYGLLFQIALSPLAVETAAAAQAALGSQLTASGTYMIPATEEAWMAGPSALINFVAAGEAPTMAMAMTMGFIHFLIAAFLVALGLRAAGGGFERQARIVLWLGIAAAFFMHLGDPIWFGFGWKMSLFTFVADSAMFIAAGLVLARWFTSERPAAPSA